MSITLLAFMLTAYQSQIDALIPWRANKIYAFSGNYYYRYDTTTNRVDPGYPKAIQGNWPGLGFTYVDAAVNWGNGKAYFFSGAYYTRYDIATDRADPGYPKVISSNWNIPWNRIDGAVNRGEGKVYFFNNDSQSYYRYSTNASAPDPGYPKSTRTMWPAIPFGGIGSAACYGGRMYVTYGNQYVRLWPSNGTLEQQAYNISYLPNAVPGTTVTGPTNNRGYGTTTAPPTAPPTVSGGYGLPNAPSNYNRPPPTANNPPPVTNNTSTCKINGALIAMPNGVYKQWNNARVELHMANSYFHGRYQQFKAAGHDHRSTMSALIKEDNLWQQSVQTVTKPTTVVSNTYGWNWSWFGFVNLKPGYYRVVVPGYANLTRWVSFTTGGQSLDVNLEHRY